MIEAYDVRSVQRAERARMSELPEGALMQRAAARLAVECARLLRERTGAVAGRRAVLLVGSGDNGGDALWAGERLARRGVSVVAVLAAARAHGPGLAALLAAGGRTSSPERAGRALDRADLVVDGLVGLRGTPGLRAGAAGLVAALPEGVPVIAVDLPSGVDPDTGETPAEHVRADVTVTFGAPKPCLLLPPADRAAGRLVVVDLGLGPQLDGEPAVRRLQPHDVARYWPVPGAADDKYRRGVVGVVAGSRTYPGAAVLAVGGAARAGAGMVRYLGPDEPARLVRERWPEAVHGGGRVQAWVLGCGVSAPAVESAPNHPQRADAQHAAIERALESGLPCVLDAGALRGYLLRALRAPAPQVPGPPKAPVLLTPHAGELAGLLALLDPATPITRADVEARPLHHARTLALATGATVLLKGSTTLVVAPEGTVASQADGPPWLATAGAGDVLAGIAGALLAAGLPPLEAGTLAALVHGRAAAAASTGGPVVASDVVAALPATLARLLTAQPETLAP